MADRFSLERVDRIEILTLADNYVDLLLQGDERIQRPPLAKDGAIPSTTLLAEHGLALMITVHAKGASHTVLLDTGYSPITVPHNMQLLEAGMDCVEAVILSHGHMDHTGALYTLLDASPRTLPLVVHPDAFLRPRYQELPDGRRLLFPQTLQKAALEKRRVEIRETGEPSFLCDRLLLVTGEVERVTDFEKGLPGALAERGGQITPDPIADDQAVVFNLSGKGLVVISGCSHAGIVNTVLYARKLTGIERVHAILGGFHLSGPFFEKVIPPTIDALQAMNCSMVVPMHCTGRKAIEAFEQAFPAAFVLNSVGSKIHLAGL